MPLAKSQPSEVQELILQSFVFISLTCRIANLIEELLHRSTRVGQPQTWVKDEGD